MKLKTLSALTLAATSLFTASSVMAEEGAWSTSGNVALSTEYVWRGVGQTDNEPAISGGIDLAHESGFYLGTWASNVDFDDDSGTEPDPVSIEIDYYAGYSADIGDTGFSYDVGGLYYQFPDADGSDAFEVYGFVSYSFLSAGVSYSVDLFDADDQDDNVYYQLDAGYDVGMISLAAGIGYYDFDAKADEDYTNYYIGASTELAGIGLDLTWHDTDLDGSDSDAVVFTISKSL
jgi:uncharacterized protein (TIGR02001 family)